MNRFLIPVIMLMAMEPTMTLAQNLSPISIGPTTTTITLPNVSPKPWRIGVSYASTLEPNGHHAYEIFDANGRQLFVIQTERPWAQALADVMSMLNAVNNQ